MLGRMLAFEYSIARSTEGVSSYIAGRLEDQGYGKHEIALMAACFGGIMFVFWSAYHTFGFGAANKKFRNFVISNELEMQVQHDEGVI